MMFKGMKYHVVVPFFEDNVFEWRGSKKMQKLEVVANLT
jgi:hypothetical protein